MNGVKKALDLYVVRSARKGRVKPHWFDAPSKTKAMDAKTRGYFTA